MIHTVCRGYYPYCVPWWQSQKEWDILLSMKTSAHITRVSKCFQKLWVGRVLYYWCVSAVSQVSTIPCDSDLRRAFRKYRSSRKSKGQRVLLVGSICFYPPTSVPQDHCLSTEGSTQSIPMSNAAATTIKVGTDILNIHRIFLVKYCSLSGSSKIIKNILFTHFLFCHFTF